MIIAEDKALNAREKTEGSKKVKIAQELIEILREAGIDIDDYSALDNSFTGYLDKVLKERFKAFEHASNEFRCEMVNIDRNEILRREIAYKRLRVKLNEDLTQVVLSDNTIKATTKQEKARLKVVNDLLKIVDDVKADGIAVNLNDLNKVIPVLDKVNPIGRKPNVHYIKTGRC
jgi:superfamily II RNA helicase